MHSTTLADTCGISYRQLDFWIRSGYVNGGPRDVFDGQGVPREIPDSEVALVRQMASFVKAGFRPSQAVVLARQAIAGEPVRAGEYELVPISTT